MKPIILAAFAGMTLAGLPALSLAACAAPSERVATTGAMRSLLQGNTVCVPAVTQPTMEAQELHEPGGALVDYKRGPTDKVDPSKQVGSWTDMCGSASAPSPSTRSSGRPGSSAESRSWPSPPK